MIPHQRFGRPLCYQLHHSCVRVTGFEPAHFLDPNQEPSSKFGHTRINGLTRCRPSILGFFRPALRPLKLSAHMKLSRNGVTVCGVPECLLQTRLMMLSICLALFCQMEPERFELSTPCLQGRCSPNFMTENRYIFGHFKLRPHTPTGCNEKQVYFSLL